MLSCWLAIFKSPALPLKAINYWRRAVRRKKGAILRVLFIFCFRGSPLSKTCLFDSRSKFPGQLEPPLKINIFFRRQNFQRKEFDSTWIIMADNEQKALQLIAEAEKKLNSSKGFLGSLFGWVEKLISHSLENFHNFVHFSPFLWIILLFALTH